MLTTMDNKYDPFKDFDQWLVEDQRLGHNCCSIQAEIANTSSNLNDEDNITITNKAIDDFVTIMTLLNTSLLESDENLKEEELVWYKIARN